MTRGDVYWAELRPRSGAEQSGRRPVVVVSSDGFNRVPGWRSVIVVPLFTSESQVRRGPSAVIVEAAQCGLDRDGVALCHQVTTLDRAKLTRRLGALPAEVLRELDDGLHAALDLR